MRDGFRELADLDLDSVVVRLGIEPAAHPDLRPEPVIYFGTGAISIDYRPNHADLTPLIRALRGLRRATRLAGKAAPEQLHLRRAMDTASITDRLRGIVREHMEATAGLTPPDPIPDDMPLIGGGSHLGDAANGDLDSLDHVEIVMAVEVEFDIEIPDDAAERLKTFKDLVAYIHERFGLAVAA